MTNVKIPLGVRVPVYLLALVLSGLGSAVVSFLVAKGVIDEVTAAFVIVVIGVVSALAHTLSLAHLSLPDSDTDVVQGEVLSSVDDTAVATATDSLVAGLPSLADGTQIDAGTPPAAPVSATAAAAEQPQTYTA